MARVTSKLQVTIPKALAQRYGIEPGQEIEWLPAGDAIRVVPGAATERTVDRRRRLELFDRATGRQREREREREHARSVGEVDTTEPVDRGWRREDLYDGAVTR
jgi:bifunctional DNA-binding transcriptional regulator/antitoxin component of YhaV-PrlF toxin-antitoxin module